MSHQEVVLVKKLLMESALLKLKIAESCPALILQMATQMAKTLRQGGKLIFFGNGGSAADAMHLAAEFVGRLRKERERGPLPALTLCSDPTVITALANDYGHEMIFVRSVQAFVDKRDTVVGLSTSGRSTNVVLGLKEAKKKGAFTMAFTGQGSNSVARQAILSLTVPSTDSGRIQEVYMCVGHILCQLTEDKLKKKR